MRPPLRAEDASGLRGHQRKHWVRRRPRIPAIVPAGRAGEELGTREAGQVPERGTSRLRHQQAELHPQHQLPRQEQSAPRLPVPARRGRHPGPD